MFGSLGGAELLIILVLALLLFGPRKLPEIGRTIGKGLTEFRKATSEFKTNLEREVDLKDVKDARDTIREAKQEIKSTIDGARRFEVPVTPPAPKPARGSSEDGGPEEGTPGDEPDRSREDEPAKDSERTTDPDADASERRST
jgi:TatA/E family protein of Tat protein translocase